MWLKVYEKRPLLLIVIFFASILFSLLFLFFFQAIGPAEHATPGTDYLNVYKPIAERILQDGTIPATYKVGQVTGPGYPVFLAFVFTVAAILGIDSFSMIIVFNVILGALNTILLFLIAERIWGPRVAVLASVAWMSYPVGLWFSKNPHTEILFIFLFYSAVLLFLISLKNHSGLFMAFAGMLFGLASLVRLVVLLFVLMKKSQLQWRFVFGAILLAAFVVTLLPWELHVYSEIGELVPISNLSSEAVRNGLIFAAREGKIQVSVPQEVRNLMEKIKEQDLRTKAEFIRFSLVELSERPIPILELLGLKAARVWYATAQGWYEGKLLLLQLLYLIPAALGIFYAFRRHRAKIPYIIFFLAVIGFFWFMAFGALSILRYMVPVMGFVMIFSALGVEFLFLSSWKKFSKQRN